MVTAPFLQFLGNSFLFDTPEVPRPGRSGEIRHKIQKQGERTKGLPQKRAGCTGSRVIKLRIMQN